MRFINFQNKYRDPQVTSIDKDESNEAFASIAYELEIAKKIEAEYLLIHFPKPMVLNDELYWSIVKYPPSDGVFESTLDKRTFINECDLAMKRLNELSNQYNIPIVLEMEFINNWFYNETWFVELLRKYSCLSICLDFSRIHLQNYIDERFDDCDFIAMLSPYTSALHVANLKVDGIVFDRHYPAFSHLNEDDGWGDISSMISALSDSSKLRNILFEHRTDEISREDVVSCYEWIRECINSL